MKTTLLVLTVFAVTALSCEKEEQHVTREYSEYLVQSPDDDSQWITIEEYNKIMDSRVGEKIGGSRAKIRCYYYPDNSGVRELGEVCAKSDKSDCNDYEPCTGKD